MADITLETLISDTRDFADAPSTADRWGEGYVLRILSSVYDAEWSNILNAAPYYRFAQRSVTTSSTGVFAMTSLDGGSGDSEQNWYRVLSMTDGNSAVYKQVDFADVPLATTTNYLNSYEKLWYLAGTDVQILPASAVALTISVNHKPTSLDDLASTASIITFPANSHIVLAAEAAALMLLKGGSESGPANSLFQLAERERARMLLDIQRRSINPLILRPTDSAADWAG